MRTVGFSTKVLRHGRIGLLDLDGNGLATPLLFPVAPLITGTTPRGGGLWKYTLQAHPYGLMRRNKPLITQVLHFLDFSVRPKSLENWRAKSLRDHYNQTFPDLKYQAPIFADSGGFKLLWNNQLDISSFGIQATPEAILALQRDMGSTLVATLDYPLPPGLQRSEAEERMRKSQDNVIDTLMLLKKMPAYRPFVFAAVHGQDSDDIRRYVQFTFAQIEEYCLSDVPLGIAIGSLVPLRGAQKIVSIIEIVRGAIAGIPEKYRHSTPVHVFGVTGNLIPLLTYLGVDTFDSSSYVQNGRSLRYFDPSTHRFCPILEMETLGCSCLVCESINLLELQEGLTAKNPNCKPLPNGLYRSKYYADIALHNLEMDYQIVGETRQAVESDVMDEYLAQHREKFPQLHEALEVIAKDDYSLHLHLTRTLFSVLPVKKSDVVERTISLKYTSESFNIVLNGYHPPINKRVLLVIPCSAGKPYSTSRTHRLISERLSQALGERGLLVHKVTLSGLYGPVPEEYENEPAILGYDFRLEPSNEAQIHLVAKRLHTYLERYGSYYTLCLGYATSRAYRTVLEEVATQTKCLQVLPVKPRTRRLTEFFRKENVEQLVDRILSELESFVY